jgi:hypothetical protein
VKGRVFFFSLWVLGCSLVALFRYTTSDTLLSLNATEWLGNLELFLVCMDVVYFILFSFLLYVCFELYVKPFQISFTFGTMFDIFLLLAYGILVFLIIPSYLYCNAIISLVHIFSHNYNEIIGVLPEITANDFIKLCVEGSPANKTQVPPMNGHILVAGKLNGSDYVCFDLKQAISQIEMSDTAKKGLNMGKNLLKIPDVLCSGVDPSQFPLSNHSGPK